MPKYIEYNNDSGHIISEISSPSPPSVPDGISLLEIPDGSFIDTSKYSVRDGVLVKLYETNSEALERERLKREYQESARNRVSNMFTELAIAILADDNDAIRSLRNEYNELKVYL